MNLLSDELMRARPIFDKITKLLYLVPEIKFERWYAVLKSVFVYDI